MFLVQLLGLNVAHLSLVTQSKLIYNPAANVKAEDVKCHDDKQRMDVWVLAQRNVREMSKDTTISFHWIDVNHCYDCDCEMLVININIINKLND